MAVAKPPKSTSTAPAKAAAPVAKPAPVAPVAKSAGAAAVPPPENEITETAVSATQQVAEPVVAAAITATVPARRAAEHAVEPMLSGVGDLIEEAKANAEVMVAVSKSLAMGLQQMAQELIEFSSERLESGVATGKALAGTVSVQDFIELSQSAAKDNLDRMLDEGGKIHSFSAKLMEDSFASLQKRVEAVVEKFTHRAA